MSAVKFEVFCLGRGIQSGWDVHWPLPCLHVSGLMGDYVLEVLGFRNGLEIIFVPPSDQLDFVSGSAHGACPPVVLKGECMDGNCLDASSPASCPVL